MYNFTCVEVLSVDDDVLSFGLKSQVVSRGSEHRGGEVPQSVTVTESNQQGVFSRAFFVVGEVPFFRTALLLRFLAQPQVKSR